MANNLMNPLTTVIWVRVLLAAVIVESAMFAVAVLLYFVPHGLAALLYVVPPACLGLTLGFGFWAARKARTHRILHGTLVGSVAALIYVALTWGKTLPTAYVASEYLKVIGGAMGGLIAQRRA
jgi:putative membrane protein (TIGR04086 family)